MQWALFCCDELTGLIIAVTLIRPDKKLSVVTVDNVLSKWNSKSFAAGVKREDIEKCEKELEIPLPDFIKIALTAMQGISKELGL
jgi:predicted hydrolase (HD superfamily)